MKPSSRDLKKEFKALQNMNVSFSDFVNVLSEKYPLDESEKLSIENMKKYFNHTKALFEIMERSCS